MSTILTTDATGRAILAPEQVASLLLRPLQEQSIAAQVSTVDQLQGFEQSTIRYPLWVGDPAVSWVPEGEEIPQGAPELDEIEVDPSKVAGLFIASNELMNDASQQAINEVGRGLVRQVAHSVDAAYFSALPAPAPQGLESITPTTVAATAGNLDWAQEALSLAPVTSFVAHPADALTIATLKESSDSNRGLLQSDPTQPAVRTVAGVPLLTSPHVTRGTLWGITREASRFVLREDASVVADTSAFFTSDRTALRATMRVGFGFTMPDQIVKVTLPGAGA